MTTREEFLELGKDAADRAMNSGNTAHEIRKVYVASAKAYAMLAAVAQSSKPMNYGTVPFIQSIQDTPRPEPWPENLK